MKYRIYRLLTFCILLFISTLSQLSADDAYDQAFLTAMESIKKAYPDTIFSSSFDSENEDWKITVNAYDRASVIYYADGRFISPEQMNNKDHYRGMIYRYSRELMDPANIPQELIDRIKNFSSAESRSSAPIASTAFFDAVYDTATAESTEKHLIYIDFLGYRIRPHEKIAGKLQDIETRIKELAKTDTDVKTFMETLGHASVYNRRTIRDTSGTSFHSMAIAIDILPKNRSQKIVYWLWERNSGNDDWMKIPLEDRWMPPASVVQIFQDEGFIWGGNWPIWDNMHFEYRPEMLVD